MSLKDQITESGLIFVILGSIKKRNIGTRDIYISVILIKYLIDLLFVDY